MRAELVIGKGLMPAMRRKTGKRSPKEGIPERNTGLFSTDFDPDEHWTLSADGTWWLFKTTRGGEFEKTP